MDGQKSQKNNFLKMMTKINRGKLLKIAQTDSHSECVLS